MASRGIGDNTHVIAVDHTGGQFATRLWWALSYYGHDAVSVLDGGWNAWVARSGPVESGDVSVERAHFTARPRPELRASAEQLAGLLDRSDRDWQLIDARDPGQFTGARRRGPRGGHIPGAINVPRELFFSPQGGFLPVEEVRRRVQEHGLRSDRPTSPIATAASRPRSCCSTWRGWVTRIWPTTTVPGTSGGAGSIFRSTPDDPIPRATCHGSFLSIYADRWRTTLIRVEDYHKTYRETVAVAGLSFEVPAGVILGLVGPNGAGKTTTMRVLAGIIRPTRGTLMIAGHDVVNDPLAAKRELAYIPDDPKLFDALTVWEHLEFIASAYRVADFIPKAEALLQQFELVEKRGTMAQELSRGMRQKVAICCAYLHDPKAILFDEPLTGLDPYAIRTLKASIAQRAADGAGDPDQFSPAGSG